MFSNIGGKIKGLAVAICIIGIVISVICGLGVIAGTSMFGFAGELAVGGAPSGVLVMLVGSFFSWICSFPLYGFGQLVQNSDRISASLNRLGSQKGNGEWWSRQELDFIRGGISSRPMASASPTWEHAQGPQTPSSPAGASTGAYYETTPYACADVPGNYGAGGNAGSQDNGVQSSGGVQSNAYYAGTDGAAANYAGDVESGSTTML